MVVGGVVGKGVILGMPVMASAGRSEGAPKAVEVLSPSAPVVLDVSPPFWQAEKKDMAQSAAIKNVA